MKIAESVARLGYEEDATTDLCIARINKGRIVQSTLADCAGRDLAMLGDVYIATGGFSPGTISTFKGRTNENLTRVIDLPFDFDLTDYLGIATGAVSPKERAEAIAEYRASATDAEIAQALRSLMDDAAEILSLLHVPITLWIGTGYGALALARLASPDQTNVARAVALHAHLVERINEVAGFKLADSSVKDAGTRLVRLPGCVNTKGPKPRPCTILQERDDGFLFLDDFDVKAPTPRPPRRIIPDHAIELSELDEGDIVLALNNVWAEGSRHAIALSVSGMLAKAGVPEVQAERIIALCADGDPEYKDRLKAVQTSYQRVRSGLEVSGYLRLSDAIPHDILQFIDSKLASMRPQELGVIDFLQEAEAPSRLRFLECPQEAFYGWFDAYRQLMAPTTEACPAFHLGTALTFAGSLVGRRASVGLGRPLYPNLFLALCGETGRSRKDTAMSRGQSFFGAMGEATAMLPYSLLLGVTSGEGLIDHLANHPHTILRLSELSTMVRRARRQGTLTLIPTLIELWDTPERIDIPRAGKDSTKFVDQPFLSLLAATTPQTLADDMTGGDIESGFANRVLWFFGDGGPPISRPPKPDAARSRRLLHDLVEAIGTIPYGTEMTLEPHAQEAWDAWYLAQYAQMHESEDDARMAQRMGANIHRIALIFAASDGATTISEDHLAAATSLVEWCFANTREQARRWGWGEEARVAIAIKDALWQGPATNLAIARYVGERIAPSLLQRTIEALVKTGQITVCSPGVFQLPE